MVGTMNHLEGNPRPFQGGVEVRYGQKGGGYRACGSRPLIRRTCVTALLNKWH